GAHVAGARDQRGARLESVEADVLHAELEVELLRDGVGQVDVKARVPGSIVAALELEGDVGHLGADGQRAVANQPVVGAGGRGSLVAAVAVVTRVAGATGEDEDCGSRDGGADEQRTTVHGHSCVTGLAPGRYGFCTHLCMPLASTPTRVVAVAVTIGLRECAVMRGRLFTT